MNRTPGQNSRLIEGIQSPRDLKKLAVSQLEDIAQECRDIIIDTVSQKGGHLASNLGAVELTLALHYAFNTPHDRIIWDVGHQVYTHKLITGRRDGLIQSLRQYKGISGFPKKQESEYDHYDTGHSGTSISFALGMAEGIKVSGSDNKIIPVIGDGSTTAGIVFEALNQKAQIKNENLIVILNDNEMSISPNVGMLAEYISHRMVSPRPANIRKLTKTLLNSIPRAGSDLVRVVQKIERTIKDLIQPGLLFEELGFQYLGPFDGHRVEGLVELFQNIKHLPGPHLVHVLTKKGKGYKHAELEPERFHGASPFDVSTGKFKPKGSIPDYTSVFGDALVELGRTDKKVVAITAAMTLGTGLKGFAEEFPQRFYDVGIAEQHAVTFAGGLAAEGLKPVVAIYSSFMQRAYDQVFHDVCLQKLPVILALDRGGLVGADGPTHHGVYDFSFLRHLPEITVIAPRDESELRRALFSAHSMDSPVAIRYPRGIGIGVPVDDEPVLYEAGTGEILRSGTDISVVGVGPILYDVLSVAETLSGVGIEVEVIDARFVKPLDVALIADSLRKTGKLLTIEENTICGGFGSAVIEAIVGSDLSLAHIDQMGVPDKFIGMGSQKQLRNEVGLSKEEIARRIKLLVNGSANKRSEKNLVDEDITASIHGFNKSRPLTDTSENS